MSRQKSRTVHPRGLAALALAAVLGGMVLGFSNPGPVRTDAACNRGATSLFLSGGRVDFGDEPHVLGKQYPAPPALAKARICWGNVGATVERNLYYDDLSTRGCAHIVVDFRNFLTPPQV